MMRGIVHNAATTSERFDTGKGVSFVAPPGWTLYSSIPADFYEESLTSVVQYNDTNGDANYMLQHMRNRAQAFSGNVKVMNNAFEQNNSGRMLQQQAVEIGGHSGLYQRWRLTAEDGTTRALVAFYITHGDHLWFSFSSTSADNEDWLFDVNKQTWQSFKFY
jgi:hypothetical protein